jgi:hypothetical protein
MNSERVLLALLLCNFHALQAQVGPISKLWLFSSLSGPPLSVPFPQSIGVPFPLLLLRLSKNIISSVGNRLLQQSDLLCFFSSSYSFSACNSYYHTTYPEIKRHKEQKYLIMVIFTYSKIMFAPAFSTYGYVSIRCRNIIDAKSFNRRFCCNPSAEIF